MHGESVGIRKVRDHGSEAFRIEYFVVEKRRMTSGTLSPPQASP